MKERASQLRSDTESGALLALHFAIVFAPVYYTAISGPGWSMIVAWLWFGMLAQGALLALHEAAHKLLFKSVARNEFVAHWLLAPLFFSDFDAFRQRHWQHHRELGEAGDPKYTYRMNISRWRFPIFVLATLTLVEGVRRSIYQSGERSGSTASSGKQALIALLVVQGLFFLSLAVVARLAHPDSWGDALRALAAAYGFVYIYGLASLGVLMIALRGIVEHRPWRDGEPRQQAAALRNFENGFLGHWIFAPYGFDDHATHHRHPGVPHYHLPDVTRDQLTLNPGAAEFKTVGSHAALLWKILTA